MHQALSRDHIVLGPLCLTGAQNDGTNFRSASMGNFDGHHHLFHDTRKRAVLFYKETSRNNPRLCRGTLATKFYTNPKAKLRRQKDTMETKHEGTGWVRGDDQDEA